MSIDKNLSSLRRFVMLGILTLFVLQFVRIKILVGGLTGSVALWYVKLMDVFAYLESLVASRDFTATALIAVLPITVMYLISGRAFCGWVCPMDFLFEVTDKLRPEGLRLKLEDKKGPGYMMALALLITSGLMNIPFFTNYISHLTNFFRFLTGSLFLLFKLPVEVSVVLYSGGIIFFLLFLEYTFPRLWCRSLCPVGRLYGIFNKFSLIRLRFLEGECGECRYCEEVCYMGVKITPNLDKPSLRDSNCIYCGRCIEACNTKGRLIRMSFRR